MAKKRSRARTKRLRVLITSDPPGLVDLEVTVERGGSLQVHLEDGPEGEGPSIIRLPGGLQDQRGWIADRSGLYPA